MRINLFRQITKTLVASVVGLVLTMPVHAEIPQNSKLETVLPIEYQSDYVNKAQSIGGLASCEAYFKNTLQVNDCRIGEVPAPAAIWLFILALLAFVGLSNRNKP